MALWVRFARDGGEGFGTLENEAVAVHSGDMLAGATPTGESLALADIRLAAPVRPGAFIGLWNNFHEAATKQGNAIPEGPLYFLKNSRSVIGPGEPIRPPAGRGRPGSAVTSREYRAACPVVRRAPGMRPWSA